ncbi:hypothetical protein [Thermotalea metallivorans]|uniref:Uncharacterized protein n=1 Tax=Thermotalea metallivorans TaxID=520762 RepID=A0A140L415_9FIRM|nr:hypothetical protein [Thermotalea metallivorans]KXG75290.1 hypothetical protein AN619_18550 [Thermotalea metallivorans]
MPSAGDIKSVKVTMYKEDAWRAKEEINNMQNFDLDDMIAWGGTFIGLAGLSISLASSIVAAAFGLTDMFADDYLEAQEDFYEYVYREMTKATNPALYAVITQNYKYIVTGKGSGWILDGQPKANYYFTDY